MQFDQESFPNIAKMRLRIQSLAMLDAIVCPEWQYRYYSFNTNWGKGEEMGSMRNGSGDDWFVLFGSFGAAIKGLDHETSIAGDSVFVSEVQKQVPQAFSSFLNEPAFGMDWVSYCYWRSLEDTSWHKVIHPDPLLSKSDDGAEEYLSVLIEPANFYQDFAKWYFEVEIPLTAIQSIYDHMPLTDELVKLINPEMNVDKVRNFATEIGYDVR